MPEGLGNPIALSRSGTLGIGFSQGPVRRQKPHQVFKTGKILYLGSQNAQQGTALLTKTLDREKRKNQGKRNYSKQPPLLKLGTPKEEVGIFRP